jgi:hypothetical protein
MAVDIRLQRVVDADGATHEIFPLPSDEASLEELLHDLFEKHWHQITFGPLIQGAAWEIRAPHAPTYVGMLDGYLTVAFGASHFHLCIGPHKGPPSNPTPEGLAQHRRTARAELYRRLDKSGAPVSWGLRLFNGQGEQQTTILLPNPHLSSETDKVLEMPDWSRLDLWDRLRARWLGFIEPDPFDRSGSRVQSRIETRCAASKGEVRCNGITRQRRLPQDITCCGSHYWWPAAWCLASASLARRRSRRLPLRRR